MESWEVLKQACDRVGAKVLAARLGLSTALVYKWCQPPRSDEEPDASGARNPLDRVRVILEITRDAGLVNWLCHKADGFYVPNAHVPPGEQEERLLQVTHRLVDDFGTLLSEISRSVEDDGEICRREARDIRQTWERLKSQAECFVVSCERGLYGGARQER